MKLISRDNDLVIVLGAIPSLDSQALLEDLQNSTAKIVHLSPIEDASLAVELFCKYEAGSEEGVVAILTKYLAKDLPQEIEKYFDALDDGYLSAETNIGEDEFEDIADMLEASINPILVFGEDLIQHERVENIKKFLTLLEKYTSLHVKGLREFDFHSMDALGEVHELKSFDGTVVVNYKTNNEEELGLLIGSRQFSIAAKSADGEVINVALSGEKCEREFRIDESLKGTIALMPVKDDTASYRYQVAKITKREVQYE